MRVAESGYGFVVGAGGALLQWGRNMRVAESNASAAPPTLNATFNGAAT